MNKHLSEGHIASSDKACHALNLSHQPGLGLIGVITVNADDLGDVRPRDLLQILLGVDLVSPGLAVEEEGVREQLQEDRIEETYVLDQCSNLESTFHSIVLTGYIEGREIGLQSLHIRNDLFSNPSIVLQRGIAVAKPQHGPNNIRKRLNTNLKRVAVFDDKRLGSVEGSN